MATVVQTDYAWPDDSIERAVIEDAGHTLVTGASTPAPETEIEALIATHNPQAIMTCWTEVSSAAIRSPTDLRIVQRIGVGLDNIAVAAATARGAWVANVPDYCIGEVSDHAIALLLNWARGIATFDRDVKSGSWNPARAQLRRVANLTVGVVGYGRIGRSTVAKLEAFGCEVLVSDPTAREVGTATLASLDDLLVNSDVVMLHAPLTPETHHMLDRERLAHIKQGAFLINVSRGPLVDNDALLHALREGRLSGAGLDVIEGEPSPPPDLVDRPDVIVTPHVAFSSDSSLAELRRRSAEEVVRVLAGERPHHACNDPKA